MKKPIKLVLVLAIWGCLTNHIIAQNRTYEDIAYDYLKEHLNVQSPSNGISKSGETKFHKLPKGNMLVDMTLTHRFEYVEELQATPGNYFAQANGIGGVTYSDKAYKKRNIDTKHGYIVFISRDGTPLKYEKRPNYFAIRTWKDYVWFFIEQHDYEVDGYRIGVFDYIDCRSAEGEPLWKMNDMMVFSSIATDNTLYLAGEYVGGGLARSIVRSVDLKTLKVKDKIGEIGDIYYNMELSDLGIKVARHKDNGLTTSFIFPYTDNDKDFQFKQIMKSYDQHKPSDQVAIGERYLLGKGFDKDEKKAFEWFQKAANQNNSEGLFKTGYCYQNGYGVSQDKEKAVNYYEKSANLGNVEAISTVAKMYAIGDGFPPKMSRAMYWQEVLAFKGNQEAQNFVLTNQTVEYEKANISSIDARNIAIKNHEKGNYKWAEFCICRAIELGDIEATLYYGLWLGKGDGIQKDYAKAEQYLTDFAEKGNIDAASLLAVIQRELNNKKKEMYWIEKAALYGDVESQLTLAEAYQNGIGVKKNKKKAFEMFVKAAQLGNQAAIKEVVYRYIKGNGIKKDDGQCIAWFRELNTENQLNVVKDFEENPKIKVDMEVVIVMYKLLAEKKQYEPMKKYAEYAVKYFPEKNAIDALNLLNGANVDYSIKNADTYMLWGQLHERCGRIGQAIECYKNSGIPKGRERADMLIRRR